MSNHVNKVRKKQSMKKARQEQLKLLRKKLLEKNFQSISTDTYTTLHGQNEFGKDASVNKAEKSLIKSCKAKHTTGDPQFKIITAPNSSLKVRLIEENVYQDISFASLESQGVCDLTLKGVANMGFTHMTEIQAKIIPSLLEGRDLLSTAKTGSEKTLAYLIPAIEMIHKLKFSQKNGTGIIIISPTREFAVQVHSVMQELLKHHSYSYGMIMGGCSRAAEVSKLTTGINIIVATPGRLLDHILNTEQFVFRNLQCLIIDEADRIIDVDMDKEMQQILELLPKTRQTMLFKTGATKKIASLVRLSLKKIPLYVDVDDMTQPKATTVELKQAYIVCPSEKRFLLLSSFLRRHRDKKVIVFFSSCMSVQFHYEILNFLDIPATCIHGMQKQMKRTDAFLQFCNADKGILLCTDIAARELKIPPADWIVQYEPANDLKDYIQRLGCVNQGVNRSGQALLILRPEELEFLQHLRREKVLLHEFDAVSSKVVNIQNELQRIIQKNYFLHKSSQEGYKSFVRAYASHHLKSIFNVETLDLTTVALSFGFTVPPYVDLDVHSKKSTQTHHKNLFKKDAKKSIAYKKVTTKSKIKF